MAPVTHISPEQRDVAARLARILPGDADLAIRCASVEDLTAMKLAAISGRGAAKDFWDLHALLCHRSVDLASALAEFERKYVSIDVGSVVRSLAYFGDADAEPLPRGLDERRWTSIKLDIQRRVAEL